MRNSRENRVTSIAFALKYSNREEFLPNIYSGRKAKDETPIQLEALRRGSLLREG